MEGLGGDRLVRSSGRPSGSITRPSSPGPTGVRATSPVADTSEPTPIASASSKIAALTAAASSDSA
jgi:hypothetical protein